MKQEKQYLLDEIQTLGHSTQQRIAREKERTSQLASLEQENLEQMFSSEKEALMGEREKLLQLCLEKSEEIKRLYDCVAKMREGGEAER